MRSLFTDTEMEPKSKKNKKPTVYSTENTSCEENEIEVKSFISRIPEWGGKVVDANNNSMNLKIIHTCTIDNFLLAFWTCTKMNGKITEHISNLPYPERNHIIDIINCVEKKEWNKAKSIWISKIINSDCDLTGKNSIIKNKTISTYGSEYEFFLNFIIQFQKYKLTYTCSACCSMNNTTKESVSINFVKNNVVVFMNLTERDKCSKCKAKKNNECLFLKTPPWLFIQKIDTAPIYVNELPKIITISRESFLFLCATIHTDSPNHFRSIYYLNNEYFLVDDLKAGEIDEHMPHLKVVTCFYYKTK